MLIYEINCMHGREAVVKLISKEIFIYKITFEKFLFIKWFRRSL